MIEKLQEIRSWIEIGAIAVAYYFILNFIKGTRGAGILKGFAFLFMVAFLGVMYLTDAWGLERLRMMLTWILSGSALALIVVFAPELRRALTHLAQSPFLFPLVRAHSSEVVEVLVEAAEKLSKNRIGALVAIERDVGLGEYVENGCSIDATLTTELLESIFYPGSPLHDGAVILRRDRVAAAGCLLPLSDDPSLSKSMGTRHRAAIGVSEETDAVALIVSEETGKVSLAVGGKLNLDFTPDALRRALHRFYARNDRPTLAFHKRDQDETPSAASSPPAPEKGTQT